MTEGIIIALITAGVGLVVAVWQGWIGGDTRRARTDDRKREQAKSLIKVTVQQGVDQFIVDLQQDPRFRGVPLPPEKFIEPICAVLELHLDASTDVIRAKLKALRDSLLHLDMAALRMVLPLTERFGAWCEDQIPTLIEIRRDLGFSRSDCDDLQEAWNEHFAFMRELLARVKAYD